MCARRDQLDLQPIWVHLWDRLALLRELAGQPGFAMAGYRRNAVKDDASAAGNRPWNRHRRFETFEDQN